MTTTRKDMKVPREMYEGDAVADDIMGLENPWKAQSEEGGKVEEKKEVVQDVPQETEEAEAPISEAVETEPKPDAAPVEETTTEEEPDELTQLREQNARLIAILNSGVIPVPTQQEAAPPPPPPPPPVQQPVQQTQVAPPKKLTQDDFEEITSSPESFQKYLDERDAITRQQMMTLMPEVANRILNTRAEIAGFFAAEDNKDLRPLNDQVTRIAAMVQNANPGLGTVEALKKAADHVRETLALRPGVRGQAQKRPAFAQPTKTRPVQKPQAGKLTKGEFSTIADEIDAMANQ